MDELGLDTGMLGLRIGGRAKSPLTWDELGPITGEQLARLDEPRQSTAPPLKRLRERHHALARMIADGMKHGEAALACGYVESRVSILMSDPTFKELVSHYSKLRTERYFDGVQAMSELHMDATEEIRERLEEDPDAFSLGHLMELVKLTADRTGKGVSTKSEVDIKVGLADRLQAGYARVLAMRQAQAIDVTPEKE
jgi:hypothetical protein